MSSEPMSSGPNPYAPAEIVDPVWRKTNIRPVQLLRRSFELIRSDYWLFLGIALVGMLIGSLVPFGILMGPMMVGMFLCFSERQRTGRTEFGTVFKGFDQFIESLIAMLIMVATSVVIVFPLVIVFLAALFFVLAQAEQNGDPSLALIPLVVAMYGMIFVGSIACYVPFMFVFQLIADRKLTGVAAVKASASAAWNNLGGVVWFIIAIGFITLLAAMACYIPALLMMPISVGAMWLLYQDVFGVVEDAAIQSE